ncbi:tape measure protein [Paenibacillus vini]|uniref:Tape measure protein N-terminal domain-containing protein n=1 Tax=Paenibacillus vini TaxID=1476024 RepID=A0ABQ4MGX6_9BACL|nr:tape measure protein [Paenibacillus vini]GIP55209.1 hypothetical protein J42TS3_42440 [Paenibacillus vini]
MATVSSTVKMFDGMSGPLKSIVNGMNMMVSTMQRMQDVTNRNTNIDKSLNAAKQQIASAEAEINRQINMAKQSQDNFNRSVNNSRSAFSRLGASIVVVNQGIELAKKAWSTMSGAMNFSDQVLSANARLGMVNDNLQTQLQLQKKVMDSANRTRSSYQATAALVSKLGLFTEGVFSNNDQMINFAERFNKVLTAGGSGTIERESATLQMSQALASGRLQGDEFRAISEAAPGILKVLSRSMNVATGDLKAMGSAGELTADVIVRAFETQGDFIEQQFKQMPVTFGDTITLMKNRVAEWIGTMNTTEGPLSKITERMMELTAWLNSTSGDQFFTGLTAVVSGFVDGLMWVLDSATNVFNFFSTNWPQIAPIVYGVVGAFAALQAIMLLTKAAQMAAVAATTIQTLATFAQIAVTNGLRVAWAGLNATMKANVFILVVTVIIALIAWLINLWNTNDKVVAGIYRAFNSVMNFFSEIPAFFWQLVEWLVVPFQWWAGSIGKIYDTVINGIISGINAVLSLINKVTGSSYEIEAKFNMEDIADKISDYAGAQKDAAYAQAAVKAQEREQKVLDFLDDRSKKRAAVEAEKMTRAGENFAGTGGGLAAKSPAIDKIDKVNKVGKIEDKVDISSEDLKTMRELAEMKSIQNFVTLTPTVSFGDTHVKGEEDIDKIAQKVSEALERSIEEEMNSGGSGVWPR